MKPMLITVLPKRIIYAVAGHTAVSALTPQMKYTLAVLMLLEHGFPPFLLPSFSLCRSFIILLKSLGKNEQLETA